MSTDRKEGLIPKMKAALAQVMNRSEAARTEETASGAPPQPNIARSISDVLRAKLRPVPARRASPGLVSLRRRNGGCQANAEGGGSGSMTPQSDSGGHTETADLPSHISSCEGVGDPSVLPSGDTLLGAKCATDNDGLAVSNEAATSASSSSAQAATVVSSTETVLAAETESLPSTPAARRAPRRTQARRRAVSLQRNPRRQKCRTVESSSPPPPHSTPTAALTAPPSIASSYDEGRPPLPKIAISRGRDGLVHQKLIFSSDSSVSSKGKQETTVATKSDQCEGRKPKRRSRSRKVVPADLQQDKGDTDGLTKRGRRRHKQRVSQTTSLPEAASTAGCTAAAAHAEDVCLATKSEPSETSSGGNEEQSIAEDNPEQSFNNVREIEVAHRLGRGRGHCGVRRRIPGSSLDAKSSSSHTVRSYARIGRASHYWPIKTSKTVPEQSGDVAFEPAGLLESGKVLMDAGIGTTESVPKMSKCTASASAASDDVCERETKRKQKRRGGGPRQENPSLAALKQREYRARRQARGGRPLGQRRKKRLSKSLVGGSATDNGSSFLSVAVNEKEVMASNGVDVASSLSPEDAENPGENICIQENEPETATGNLEQNMASSCANAGASISSDVGNAEQDISTDRVGAAASMSPDEANNPSEAICDEERPPGTSQAGLKSELESTVIVKKPRRPRGRGYITINQRMKERRKQRAVNRQSLGATLFESGGPTRRRKKTAQESMTTWGTPGAASSNVGNASESATVRSTSVASDPLTPSNENLTAVPGAVPGSAEPADESAVTVGDATIASSCQIPNANADKDHTASHPPKRRMRGSRRSRGIGKQRHFPAGETFSEYKKRMQLLHSGRALPLPRGRPVGPVLLLKRFLKTGWEQLKRNDIMPTPEEDCLIWETVIEVSTDVDGDYSDTLAKIDAEANHMYKKARAALEIEELMEIEKEHGSSDNLLQSYFGISEETMSRCTSIQPTAGSDDALSPEPSKMEPSRKILRVWDEEGPQRSVHIAYRGKRGEEVDVIDGFRFVSFNTASAMIRFTRREEQRARRLRRKERRKAAMLRMKAARENRLRLDLDAPNDWDDPDWDPYIDLSDTELRRAKLPDLDQPSSPSEPEMFTEQMPILEPDSDVSFELPFSDLSSTFVAPTSQRDSKGEQSHSRCHGRGGGRGRGRGRGQGRGRGRGRGRGSGSLRWSCSLRVNRFCERKRELSRTSSSTFENIEDEYNGKQPSDLHQPGTSRPDRKRSRRRNAYEEIREIAREAFAQSSHEHGTELGVAYNSAVADRVQVTVDTPPASDAAGIFSSPELEEYLRDHSSLRISLTLPASFVVTSVARAASPPPVPAQQEVVPQRPPPDRLPDEPRCRTVLERLAWLGYRTKEELEAGLAKQLDDAVKAKASNKEPDFDFDSVPAKNFLRSRQRPRSACQSPASPRDHHVPLVSRAGCLMPLSAVSHRSMVERRSDDKSTNSQGTALYAYDQHQQLLIRGSVPCDKDVHAPQGRPGFRVPKPSRIVRPEHVIPQMNRHNEYRVNTVPVDCIMARMAASAVCDDSAGIVRPKSKPRVRKRTPCVDPLGRKMGGTIEEKGMIRCVDDRGDRVDQAHEARQVVCAMEEEVSVKRSRYMEQGMDGEGMKTTRQKVAPAALQKLGGIVETDDFSEKGDNEEVKRPSCSRMGNKDDPSSFADIDKTSARLEEKETWETKEVGGRKEKARETAEVTQPNGTYELSMGTDVSPHKIPEAQHGHERECLQEQNNQKYTERTPAAESTLYASKGKCNREMLRLGLHPAPQTKAGESSVANGLTACGQEACQMGCVCSSLSCPNMEKEHCGQVQCMLCCTCNSIASVASSTPPAPSQTGTDASGHDQSPACASLGPKSLGSVAGSRMKRTRKVPLRYTKQDVWYGGPLLFGTSDVITPRVQARSRMRLPSHLPMDDEDVLDRQYFQLSCRVRVRVPLYRLPQVSPFCIVHQSHNCRKYAERGSCYKLTAHRLRQLGRNVAVRSRRLPPTIFRPRHDHSARTFAVRKTKRPMEFLPLKHSCLLAGAVYKGAQAPRLPVPPRRPPTIVQLPDPVACQDVERVVRIVSSETSATAPNNTQHVAVRLRNGMLNVLSSTPVPPGMTWRIESADDVLVADKDGHRFRNPPEGQRLNAVSVEDSEGQLYRMPLVTINYQLQFLRARAISRDGVITIYAKDAPQSDKRRKLYRVNMRTHKLHESGMVLLRRVTAGTFIVIGIVKACDEEKEWIAEAVRFLCGLGGGMVQSSLRCMLEAFDIDRVWQLNSASAYRMPTTSVPTSLEEKGKTSQMIRYVSPSRAPKHFLRPVSSTDVPSLSLTCEESVSDADGDQVCTLKDGSGAPAFEQQRSQKRPRCHPIKQRVVPTEVQKRVCLSDGESAAGGAPQKAPHPCELNQQRESVATDIPPQKPLSARDKKPAAEGAPQILPLMSRPTQQQAGISPDIQTQMSACNSRKPSSGETPQSALPMGGLSQQCLSSSPDEQTQTPPCSSNTSAAGASLSVPPSSGLKQACYGGSPRIRLRVEDGKVVAVTQGGKNIQVAATKSSKDVTKGHMKVAVKGGISTVSAAAKDGSVSGCGLLGTNCSLDGDASNVTEHAPGSVSSCGKLGLAVTEDAQPNAKSSNCDKIIVSFKRHEQEALRKAINAAHQVPTKAFPLLAPRQPTTLQPGQLSGQPTLKSTDVTVLRQGKPCDVIRVSVSTVSQVPAASKSVSGAGSKSASGAGANPPVPGSLPTVTLSGSALSGQSKPVSTVNIKRGDPTSQNPSQAAKPTVSRQSGETKRQTTTTTVSDAEKAATSSQTPSYTVVSSSRSFLCMGKSSALPKPQTVDSSASCRAQSLTSSQSNSEVGDAAKVTRATKEVMHQKPGPTSKTGPELPQVVQSGKERQGLSTTMASQSAANQNEQNKAKSTGGARLSYVRMPPERVEGRMVTARFGGKPSRWNMIEVDKVPDLMHVDGIPISLTKRYLKHAVHQVKNTGRPVSTKVNNVLVTIVWMPHLPDFVFLGPIKEQPGTRSSTEPVPVAVAGSTAPAPSALGVAAVAGQRTPTETVTSTATSSGPTQRPSTASKTVIIPSKPKAKATSASPPSAATRPHVVKAEALSRRVGNDQRPPAPSAPPAARRAAPAASAAATVDPLSPSMELSAALAFDEPGASATGDSDDEVVVLPPPPPRAPLDVILLDNSDISDDELVLDTNTECPERMPAASQSVGEASTSGPGRPRSGGIPTASSVQTPAAAAPASGGASHETAPSTVPTPAVAASHVNRPSAKAVPDVEDQISAKAAPHVIRPSTMAVPHVDRPSAKAAPQVDRPSAKAVPHVDRPSAKAVPHVIRPSAKAVPHVIRPSAKASPSSSGPLKRVLPPPSAPLLRAVLAPSTVGSGAGTRDPGRPSTSSAPEEPSPARPEPDGATATDSEPRPKRRKQQLQERPIQSPVPPFVPTPPRVRVRVNAGEYTAAKHALEELLFGRLENATPIKRQTVLVLKTAQEEVRVQRSRHSQLKVRLWQVSQKQRNLLNRLNRGLAELPLEKRIEKIAEIEDLLSFVQVRVDGDEHEPVMLLEQKQSQQPSQFRVIAPDGVPAAPPSAEDTDADELSVM